MKCACGNVARYVDVDGEWWCALCAMAKPALRAIDAPAVVHAIDELLDELDRQAIEAGGSVRQDLRGLLGRWRGSTPQPSLPGFDVCAVRAPGYTGCTCGTGHDAQCVVHGEGT